ncbi:MAG: M20/M25/M40 family metallo-hydrolase, partial [Planctomycetota bacterium]
ALERRWARPTLDCNGIVGGYTDEGSKTIIPASASAKISMRLVADQDPDKVIEGLRAYLDRATPPGVSVHMDVHAGARPVMIPRESPVMRAAAAAFEEGFGGRPAFIRCGASVPVTELFQRLLGVEPVLMGFGLPDDNLHAPNEKFELTQLQGGALAVASLLGRLKETRPYH